VTEDDGTTTFWRGHGIAQRISRGEELGGANDRSPWMKVRVSQAAMERARMEARGLLTLSMEASSDFDIEVTVRTSAHKPGAQSALENLVFRPGDPFLSGHVQIQVTPDGAPQALFSVIRWVPMKITPTSYAWAQQVFETGLAETDLPPLKFKRFPFNEPLPASWRLPE
jgi:hypothetical protein